MANGTDLQSAYKSALRFAALKHRGQKITGTQLPYLVHVTNVAMEVMIAGFHTPGFDTRFAVQVALLHDTIEDTKTTYSDVQEEFDVRVAEAVLALTKFSNLEKDAQITDSLERIKQLEKEVWAVKLADRITNLEAPPLSWKKKKREKYLKDAQEILRELGEANHYLAHRLQEKIAEYANFVLTGEK